MSKRNALLAAVALVAVLAAVVVAQEGEVPPEVMKAMMPGEHHEPLKLLAGEYTLAGSAWMVAGAEPMTFTGTRSAEMILDGRYLRERVVSEFMGMPFKGFGILAYDNTAEHYIYAWLDNMGTAVTTSYGSYGEDGWTLEGEHADPATGKTEKFKNTFRLTETGFVFEWFEQGRKNMEITYTRK